MQSVSWISATPNVSPVWRPDDPGAPQLEDEARKRPALSSALEADVCFYSKEDQHFLSAAAYTPIERKPLTGGQPPSLLSQLIRW